MAPQIPVRPPEPPKTRSWFDYARQNVPALSGIGALLAVVALIGLGAGFQISRRFILPLRRQWFQSNPAPGVIQPTPASTSIPTPVQQQASVTDKPLSRRLLLHLVPPW